MRRLILVCVACAAPCWAADPLAGVLSCRALQDAGPRLACFDRETAALLRAPAAPNAVASTTMPASQAAPAAPMTPEQKFGLSGSAMAAKQVAAGTRAANESKLQGRITALAMAGDGRTLFTLDNSQVWRQLEADGSDMLAKLGDAVTISRGILGSYWLQLKSGRGCKVTRLH